MNTRCRFIIMIFLASSLTAFGQQYKYLYYLDESLNIVERSVSILTGKAFYENGVLKMDCFRTNEEKLLISATFTDSTLNELQGPYLTYHDNGIIAWQGDYVNNEKQGLWQQWNKKGFKTDSVVYENNNRLRFAKFSYYEKETLKYSFSFTDSIADIFTQTYLYKNGNLLSEVVFAGQKGLLKSYDSTGTDIKTDSVFTREEIEASFPGGDVEWRNYLRKNLDPDVPAKKGAPGGMYSVVIKFMITKDGTLTDIAAETNKGYGTEEEALRLIKKSPKWKPATQYGRFVNAYRRQPITFVVDNRR